MFDQELFNSFVVSNNVVGLFEEPVKLKSGRMSNWYVNWRTVAEDAFLLDKLSDFVLDFVSSKGIPVDTFYGVPEGATKLGIITQYKYAKSSQELKPGSHVLAMGRGKPKEHGMPKDRYFLGLPKGKVVVLEDVMTTGGSLINAVKALQEAGVEISAVVVLTDRNEKRDDGRHGGEVLREMGVPYYAMSNALDLLPIVLRNASEDLVCAVKAEFGKWGVKDLEI